METIACLTTTGTCATRDALPRKIPHNLPSAKMEVAKPMGDIGGLIGLSLTILLGWLIFSKKGRDVASAPISLGLPPKLFKRLASFVFIRPLRFLGHLSRHIFTRRIILIGGATALVYVLMTSPKVVYVEHGIAMRPDQLPSHLAEKLMPVIEVRTAAIRAAAVLGATLLLFFAANRRP